MAAACGSREKASRSGRKATGRGIRLHPPRSHLSQYLGRDEGAEQRSTWVGSYFRLQTCSTSPLATLDLHGISRTLRHDPLKAQADTRLLGLQTERAGWGWGSLGRRFEVGGGGGIPVYGAKEINRC